jgi:hypothetical protein
MAAILRIPQADAVTDPTLKNYFNEVNRVNNINFNTLNQVLGPLANILNSRNLDQQVIVLGKVTAQYGSITGSNPSVTFPVAFSDVPAVIFPVALGASNSVNEASRTKDGFTTTTSGSITINWLAIGPT